MMKESCRLSKTKHHRHEAQARGYGTVARGIVKSCSTYRQESEGDGADELEGGHLV